MKFTRRIKAWLRYHRAARKLKRSGHSSWASYRQSNDPDVFYPASEIKHFYHGYDHVHVFPDYTNPIYELIGDYGPGGLIYGMHHMHDWCKQNLRFKWRIDCHRVLPVYETVNRNGFFEVSESKTNFTINEIGGRDMVFFACKDDRDYTLFMLKWA